MKSKFLSASAVKDLVEQQRMRCLWYMPDKYYPTGIAETLSILKKIQRYGDLAAYKKAGKLICQLQRSKG
jgi:hypothetical protein